MENQHLKHGKALCGNVFARFVETFNALVDFMCNVKGDADGKDGEGHIKFDRSNPAHPVIRCEGCTNGDGGGSVTVVGTDESSASGTKIVFASAEDSNIEATISSGDDGSVIVTIGAYYK